MTGAQKWANWLMVATLILAALAGATVAMAGFGYRWGLWGLDSGFAILPYGAYGGAAAAVLGLLVGLFAAIKGARVAALLSFAAIAMGGAALAFPLDLQMRAKSAPPIHDISTDTIKPPPFVALKALRDAAPNGSGYSGIAAAIQQKQAYPDIVTMRTGFKAPEVLARAQTIARDLGWEIVATTAEGFEATVTTAWWGFIDDVVVRLTSEGNDTRVDLRSASRLGTSDLGVNAQRIRAFMTRFQH